MQVEKGESFTGWCQYSNVGNFVPFVQLPNFQSGNIKIFYVEVNIKSSGSRFFIILGVVI